MKTSNVLRQKLINMMYLVLIAMIVLNPALEYVEIFTELNRSIERSNVIIDGRNESALRALKRYSQIDTVTYKGVLNRILLAKEITDSTILYLDSIKNDLISSSGGYGKYKHLAKALDSGIPTRKIYRKGVATDMKERLTVCKERLLDIMSSEEQVLLDTVLITSDTIFKAKGVPYNWEKYYFDNVPLAATVAILTKFQNDIRLSQSIVIRKYFDRLENGYNINFVPTDSSGVDSLLVETSTKKEKPNEFSVGEAGVAKLSLPGSAGNAARDAKILLFDEKGNVIDSFMFKNGIGEVSLRTDQIGEFRVKGQVKYRYPNDGSGSGTSGEGSGDGSGTGPGLGDASGKGDGSGDGKGGAKDKDASDGKSTGKGDGKSEGITGPDGGKKKDTPDLASDIKTPQQRQDQRSPQEFTQDFEINYKVVNKTKPFIAQKEFKVLYIGVNNPVEIYHPDFNPAEYRVNITQGELILKNNQFYAKVSREGFATVSLSVPDKVNGGFMKVSEETFKVKYLPRPEVVLYNKTGGEMAAKIFKQQNGLDTNLRGLELDEKFRVIEYTVTYINGKGLGIFKEQVRGSYFTGKSRELIELAQPGDIYIFDNIYVKGPDGQNQKIDALIFTIN